MEYKVNNLIYAAGKDLHNTMRTRIEMTEPVDAVMLRKAADTAIKRYPYFSVKLVRRGEEYMMVSNDAPLTITQGGRAIPLGGSESRGHLFAIAYDGCVLYIDTSHFITDGNGKFPFIKTLLYCYLSLLHPEDQFHTSGIALPDSEISSAEAEDDPFPKEEAGMAPLGFMRCVEEVLLPDEQPGGYESRDRWTSFRLKVKQKDMMEYTSTVDGSPATFLASVMYQVFSQLYPDSHLPVVCGMQHQYRKALGNPYSHLCHVNIVPIVYPEKVRGREIGFLNAMARGTTIIRTDIANDMVWVDLHIANERKIKELTLEEKQEYMRDFLKKSIGKNTFEVSYTGRVPFDGLDKYISDFTPIIDMSLSGGISIEIFSLGEYFCIHIMQRTEDRRYVERFIRILEENGIACMAAEPEPFEINDFVAV